MSFCQVVLKKTIIESIRNKSFIGLTKEMKHDIQIQIDDNPEHPIPIPTDDKAPQVSCCFNSQQFTHTHARTHTYTHAQKYKWTSVKPSTSFHVDLEVSCKITPPASRESLRALLAVFAAVAILASVIRF